MSETYRGLALGKNAVVELHVIADDRTGATETAAALADSGVGQVPVEVWPSSTLRQDVIVTDISSRSLDRLEAAERAAQADRPSASAHKIDSTLRGNWADELMARIGSSGRPTLIVPALPSQGRTCVDGIVRIAGGGVADPAAALERVGSTDVSFAPDVGAVRSWLAAPEGFLVADAADDRTIRAIVGLWANRDDVILAGTSVVIGAAGLVALPRRDSAAMPRTSLPVLTLCGSLNPMARTQIAEAVNAGFTVAQTVDERSLAALRRQGSLILETPSTGGPQNVAAANELARDAHRVLDEVEVGAVVVIGGDTAAAVLGTETATVYGSLGPGTAWLRTPSIVAPVVTRAGGFGSDHWLVDLLSATLRG
jgi:uncharacterized protein YgbK (DUF1537 family)